MLKALQMSCIQLKFFIVLTSIWQESKDQFDFKCSIANKNLKFRENNSLVPCFCYTIHKAQGKTSDKAIIDLASPQLGIIDNCYSCESLEM